MSAHLAGLPCGLPSIRSTLPSRQPCSSAQSSCSILQLRGATADTEEIPFLSRAMCTARADASLAIRFTPDLLAAISTRSNYELVSRDESALRLL